MTSVRWVLIFVVLAVWLGVGAIGGQAQGKLSSVQTNDSAAFLPSSAESTRAAAAASDFVSDESVPALVVFTSDDGAIEPSLAQIQVFAEEIADLPLSGASAQGPMTIGDVLLADPVVVPAEDGLAAMIVLSVDGSQLAEMIGGDDDRISTVLVADLRAAVAETFDDSVLTGLVTGPVGFIADLVNAFGGIDMLLLVVALVAVLAILMIVYRSPILPFIVIFTAVFALCLAGLVVYGLADAGTLTLNGQAQGIMSILVVGASVDYALLLVARFREELTHEQDPTAAMRRAVRASIAPIAASAATVAVGLACLLLSDLASNSSLGPVGCIAIAAAFLAALTFLPAVLLVAGKRSRGMFWPHTPQVATATQTATQTDSDDEVLRGQHAAAATKETWTFWSRLARFVGKHDRRVWISTTVVLLACAAFVPMFNASGTSESDIFLTDVDAVAGEQVLTEHFPTGAVQPAYVILPKADLAAAQSEIVGVDGVDSVQPTTEDSGGSGPGGMPDPDAEPLEVDGRVRLDVITVAGSDTIEAAQTIERVRAAVHAVSPQALVGGAAAEMLDTQLAGARDLRVIVPVVLIVILGILMLLLRAVLIPVLIMVANVLSFGAAMGVAALVFKYVFGFPGADPAVPLYAFCFLVALGVDYTIFLMTRVREETHLHGTREGVLKGLRVTGSVITSAGIVLAATFAALGVIPLLFLAQIAFIVSFGVLLDTMVVRTLLVPALVHDLGRRSWWPSKLSR